MDNSNQATTLTRRASASVVLLLSGTVLIGCSTPQGAMDRAMEEAEAERQRNQTSESHDDAMDRMDRRRQQ